MRPETSALFGDYLGPFATPGSRFYVGGAGGIDTLALDWLALRTSAALTVVVPGKVDDQPLPAVAAVREWERAGRLTKIIELGVPELDAEAHHARNRWMVDGDCRRFRKHARLRRGGSAVPCPAQQRGADRQPRAIEHHLKPVDPAMDRIAQLHAAVARRDTVPVEERAAEARAHAIAAGLALREQDPSVALASAMYNACQADRARSPALRVDVRAQLS